MATKLFNQGKRTIHGNAIDARDGKEKPFAFLPKTALEFDDEVARKLKKMFGAEMLSIDDVKGHFDIAPPAAEATPAAAQPATNKPLDDAALATLSEDERAAVLALRAAKPPEAAAAPVPPVVNSDPSDFVNVTEEEGKAALAAIQAVRDKKAAEAAANDPNADQNQPASLMQKVRDALKGA